LNVNQHIVAKWFATSRKSRNSSEGVCRYFVLGDPNGKHVVIVDDLVQTGGTLIECAKVSSLNILH